MDSVNELIERLRASGVKHGVRGSNSVLMSICDDAADVLLSQAQEIERIRSDASRALGNMLMIVPEERHAQAHLWIEDAITVLHSLNTKEQP